MNTRKENRGSVTKLGAVETLHIVPVEERATILARLKERPDIVEALNWIIEHIDRQWINGGELALSWEIWIKEFFPDDGWEEFELFACDSTKQRLVLGPEFGRHPGYLRFLDDYGAFVKPSVRADLAIAL